MDIGKMLTMIYIAMFVSLIVACAELDVRSTDEVWGRRRCVYRDSQSDNRLGDKADDSPSSTAILVLVTR